MIDDRLEDQVKAGFVAMFNSRSVVSFSCLKNNSPCVQQGYFKSKK